MFDSAEILERALKEAPEFKNHAAKELDIQQRLLYLKMLALVMSVDKRIRNDEQRYFLILLRSLAVSEAELSNIIGFAKKPDVETVQRFFSTFRRSSLAQLFLFDALTLTRNDDQSNDAERDAIDKIANKLELLKGTQQDVYDLFCHIKNRNWRESAPYFSSYFLTPEYFTHLLEYYHVNLEQLMEETESLRKDRLQEMINRRIGFGQLQWGHLSYREATIESAHRQVTTKPVERALDFNYAVMVPFLRSLIARRQLRIANGIGYLQQQDEELEVLDLKASGLVFDPETETLYKAANIDEQQSVEWAMPLLAELLGLDMKADLFTQLEQVTGFLGCSFPKVIIQNNKYHLPRCNGEVCVDRHQLEGNGNRWSPVVQKGKRELGWVGLMAERSMDEEWPIIRCANKVLDLELWEEEGIGTSNAVTLDKNECKQGPEWSTRGMDPYKRPWYIPSKEAGFNFHKRRLKRLEQADIRDIFRNGVYLTR